MIPRTLTIAVLAVSIVSTITAPNASAQTATATPTRTPTPTPTVTPLTLPPIEFQCYQLAGGGALNQPATLKDQFDQDNVLVQEPQLLCNPATKRFNGRTFGGFPTITAVGTTVRITLPHLQCYRIEPDKTEDKTVTLRDQFGTETDVKVTASHFLCTTVIKTVTGQ